MADAVYLFRKGHKVYRNSSNNFTKDNSLLGTAQCHKWTYCWQHNVALTKPDLMITDRLKYTKWGDDEALLVRSQNVYYSGRPKAKAMCYLDKLVTSFWQINLGLVVQKPVLADWFISDLPYLHSSQLINAVYEMGYRVLTPIFAVRWYSSGPVEQNIKTIYWL